MFHTSMTTISVAGSFATVLSNGALPVQPYKDCGRALWHCTFLGASTQQGLPFGATYSFSFLSASHCVVPCSRLCVVVHFIALHQSIALCFAFTFITSDAKAIPLGTPVPVVKPSVKSILSLRFIYLLVGLSIQLVVVCCFAFCGQSF